MPASLTYPGVYIEEIPSGVRTITGVSTSDTAFIDFFARGPVGEAVRITSFSDFERTFGGLDTRSEASYAIRQFYLNGGSIAWIVRVTAGSARAATLTLQDAYLATDVLGVAAASAGTWASTAQGGVQVGIDHNTSDRATLFNLAAREVATTNGQQRVVRTELFRNLSMDATNSRYSVRAVNDSSQLVELTDLGTGLLPNETAPDITQEIGFIRANGSFVPLGGNPSDGDIPGSIQWDSSGPGALEDGLAALDRIAPFIFNILCIPAAANFADAGKGVLIPAAETFCEQRRAFLIVDIPEDVTTPELMVAFLNSPALVISRNAAVYFPRLEMPDPLNENRPRNVGASGTMAGIYARTDSQRGVWKAPAGVDATIRGASLAMKLTDLENGGLNPLGINALRNFPIFADVSWGARTLEGADMRASEWKYIPVRRTALYIEESLYQGLKWVVFEPNDERLWSQIRLNVGAFMQDLFIQGAFQGTTPTKAYFVKCDSETTTQTDINNGVVNILVGFAPLKPAEFVVIQIQQMAGQIET